MRTLQDELIACFGAEFDKHAETTLNNQFLNNKDSWVRQITEEYLKYNKEPNETISKIAVTNNLNDEQIKRVVEESNVSIYLRKYAQVKNTSFRDVVFPLADAAKIQVSHSAEAPNSTLASENTKKFEKAASYEGVKQFMKFASSEEAFGDCFTNSASSDFSLWEKGTAERDAVKNLLRRKQGKSDALEFEKKSTEVSLINKIGKIGNSLVYNARSLGNTQGLFDSISKEANLDDITKKAILFYVDKKITMNKEAGYLPSNFELVLNKSASEENPFSLGKHSLLEKEAGDVVVNVENLPENISYDDLVSIAREIKKELNENPVKDTTVPLKLDEVSFNDKK